MIVGVAILGGCAGRPVRAPVRRGHAFAGSPGAGLSPWLALALLPDRLRGGGVVDRPLSPPEAAGSGIPQVIAAADRRWTGRWGGQRVTLRTAAFKVMLTAGLLVCGASIGREGPHRAGRGRHHAHADPRPQGRSRTARADHRRRRGRRLGGVQHPDRRGGVRSGGVGQALRAADPHDGDPGSRDQPDWPPTRLQGDYSYFRRARERTGAGIGVAGGAGDRGRLRLGPAACSPAPSSRPSGRWTTPLSVLAARPPDRVRGAVRTWRRRLWPGCPAGPPTAPAMRRRSRW